MMKAVMPHPMQLQQLHWYILHELREGGAMHSGKLHELLDFYHRIGHLDEPPETRTALLELEYWKLVRVNQATGEWLLTVMGMEFLDRHDPDEDA